MIFTKKCIENLKLLLNYLNEKNPYLFTNIFNKDKFINKNKVIVSYICNNDFSLYAILLCWDNFIIYSILITIYYVGYCLRNIVVKFIK